MEVKALIIATLIFCVMAVLGLGYVTNLANNYGVDYQSAETAALFNKVNKTETLANEIAANVKSTEAKSGTAYDSLPQVAFGSLKMTFSIGDTIKELATSAVSILGLPAIVFSAFMTVIFLIVGMTVLRAVFKI